MKSVTTKLWAASAMRRPYVSNVTLRGDIGNITQPRGYTMPNRNMQAKHIKGARQRAIAGSDYGHKLAMYAMKPSDHVVLVSCLARQETVTHIGGVKVSREAANRIAAKKSIAATHW